MEKRKKRINATVVTSKRFYLKWYKTARLISPHTDEKQDCNILKDNVYFNLGRVCAWGQSTVDTRLNLEPVYILTVYEIIYSNSDVLFVSLILREMKYIFWVPYFTSIYIYLYISSSSYRAGSTDISDPLSPLLPIVHRPRQVFRTTTCILT